MNYVGVNLEQYFVELCCQDHLFLFPSSAAGITKCAISNEDCLRDGMNYVLRNHARTGIKQLGLVQLDPLQIKKFALGKNPNSPVSVDLTFTDASLLGLAEAQVKRVS